MDELSPSQLRKPGKRAAVQDIGQGLISYWTYLLRGAKTAYAKTQVELAQYQYLLPRLTPYVDSP